MFLLSSNHTTFLYFRVTPVTSVTPIAKKKKNTKVEEQRSEDQQKEIETDLFFPGFSPQFSSHVFCVCISFFFFLFVGFSWSEEKYKYYMEICLESFKV